MESKLTAHQPVYEDFTPPYKRVQEEGFDILIVELPDFKREQIRVHLEKPGKLSIIGERPLAENRWSRFQLEFQVPNDYKKFDVNLENGHLYVKILPKFSKPVQVLMKAIQVLKNAKQALINVIVVILLILIVAWAPKNKPEN